ncbi:MAG: ATP-binding cassette domain-containing protein [Spirochaetaceae bacterium]|jgi:ABC-type dipeptide/oligopeptide/nickel transport system ATPase subunit|nr:ATP-binding cassette domain-containing protein [Spirochaetaceae bacterium]
MPNLLSGAGKNPLPPALLGQDLWKVYGPVYALRGVTIQVEQGEAVGLVGETGSGKSSAARILCGLNRADRGDVSLDGTVVPRNAGIPKTFRKRVQMVFQDSSGSLDPRMAVRDILAEPLGNYAPGGAKKTREQVKRLLEAVGLDEGIGRRYPHEISGGQRQRVVIARALAPDPDYLVCDEPLSGLDAGTQGLVLHALRRLGGRRGILFISHDLACAARVSRRLYVMFAGRAVEHLRTEDIPSAAHPYTRALFGCLFRALGTTGAPETKKGLGPGKTGADFGVPENGCPFRLQCPEPLSLCGENHPPARWVNASQNHWARCYRVKGGALPC